MASRELKCSCNDVDVELLNFMERTLIMTVDVGERTFLETKLLRLSEGCGIQKVGRRWIQFPKRQETLDRLDNPKIIGEHGDGDLTVQSQGKLYVVTTEGQLFEEK